MENVICISSNPKYSFWSLSDDDKLLMTDNPESNIDKWTDKHDYDCFDDIPF